MNHVHGVIVKPATRSSLALVLCITLATLLASCGGKEGRVASHLEKGNAYFHQANYDKARVEIRNVLQIDPKNAEGYYLLALMDEQQQNWQSAFGGYSKAVELNPDHIKAKAKLGRLYLMAGKLDEAEQRMNEVLAKSPDDPGGRFLKAALLFRKGDIAGAVQEASSVLATNPTSEDATSLLAGLYTRQGDESRAQQLLERAVRANPKSIPLQLDLAAVAARRNELATVEKAYVEIVAAEPQTLRYRTGLASFYIDTNQLDKAEKTLRSAIEANPDDVQRYLLLAQFLATRRSPGDAESELRRSINAKPEAYALQFSLARLYELTGKPEQAEQIYRSVINDVKTRPERLKAKVLLAQMKLASGESAAAEKLIADVLTQSPTDTDALWTRARIALAKGDARQSVADLRVVLRDRPESLEVLSLLSSAHMANNEPQLAKEIYNNAIVRHPNNANLRLGLARFLAANQEYDAALKETNTALNANPQNAAAYELKAEIQVAVKDWNGAQETLRRLKSALPSQPTGDYLLGRLYLAQNKLDQAAAQYELALKQAPNAIEPLTGVVTVLLLQGKPDKAVARINTVIQTFPNDVRAYSLLAQVYARQKNYADAEATMRKAMQVDTQATGPYLGLANLYAVRGDTTTAVDTLQQAVRNKPTQAVAASYAIAEIYQRAGQKDKAMAEYEKILAKDPGADVAANNLAGLLGEHADNASLERALALAKRFENSSNPAFLDTLGWMYLLAGNQERALPLLKKAVTIDPRSADLRYHLGTALYKSGDVKSAKTQLQLAVNSKAQFAGADDARAMLAKM